MKYNIAQNGKVETNSTLGSVILTTSQIALLLNNTLNYTVSGTDVLVLDCDLGNRMDTDEIRYYFTSSTASGTVSGTVSFYAGDEGEDYYPLVTNLGDSYYYATATSGIGAPRYIRVTHTLSGTAISGTVEGFEVYNDDTVIDFGEDGSKVSEGIITSLDSQASTSIIPVFNSGTTNAKAYVSLDPQYNYVDDVLTISDSTSGPWYGVNENNIILSDSSTEWNRGTFSDTRVVDDMLKLSSGQSTGTYTSRIFYVDMPMSYTLMKLLDEVNQRDLVQMEVRSSNVKPLNFQTLAAYYYWATPNPDEISSRECYWDGHAEFRKIYLYDQTDTDQASCWYLAYDELTDSTYFIDNPSTRVWTGRSTCKVFLRHNLNGSVATYTLSYTYNYSTTLGNTVMYTYFFNFDINKGTWIYIRQDRATDSGYVLSSIGYYLIYLNVSFTNTVKIFSTATFVAGMDTVYATGDLWYTDSVAQVVNKMSNSGTIVAYYNTSSTNLGEVSALEDGGCWFVDGTDLVRLSATAGLVETLEDVSDTAISHMVMTPDKDAFWIVDNEYIKKIDLTGRLLLSVYVTTSPIKLYSVRSGVWYLGSVDHITRFISTDRQAEISAYQWNSGSTYKQLAFRELEYDTYSNASLFPTSYDTHWNNLEWKEVNYRFYTFPVEKYHQVRLTLTSSLEVETPEVERFSVQKSVEIDRISPNSYENVYLKVEVPDPNDNSGVGDYTTYLKVRWGIPI